MGDVVTKRITGEIIHHDEGGVNLRQEIRARKDAALGDAAKPAPVSEWRADILPVPGDSESTESQLRRASKNMGHTRREAFADDMASTGFVDHQTAAGYVDRMKGAPPPKMQVISDHGAAVPPLDDQQPITEDLSFRNLREAQRAVKNYRDAQDRYQEALAQELAKEQENKQWVSELEAAARQHQTQQAAQPAPQPQPAVDPLAQERAALAAQRRQLEWDRLSEGEQAAHHELEQLRQWFATARGDERAQSLGHAEQRWHELQGYAHEAAQLRHASQTNAQQARQQQINDWGAQQDTQASAAIKADMPEYASDEQWRKLQAATRRAIKESTGLNEQQIGEAWQQGHWRSVPEQRLLARLGRAQLLQEGAKNMASKRAPVPPVQRPGVARPAGADAAASIAGLERELSEATGVRAHKIAVRLTQARRAAGLL
jgi:hypothetical protein